ncbi:MAG: hypothetical protein ACKV0T_19920 [Planctomycetales bacterium]
MTRRLHALIAHGQGDSQEADALRDEMDGPWYRLSEAEQLRARGLSGDLYSLSDEETHPRDDTGKSVTPEELQSAWDVRDWDRVLELLRAPPGFLTRDQIAFLRGYCWREIGDPETALLFFQKAEQICPENGHYGVTVVDALVGLQRVKEAHDYARRWIESACWPAGRA